MTFFNSKINGCIFIIMIIVMIYHGKLGLQVILEDYINKKTLQSNAILVMKFFSYFLILVSLMSLFIVYI